MIVLPHKRVIIAPTPRVASRAVEQAVAMAGIPEVYRTPTHHVHPQSLANIKADTGYNVWALVRNPVDQLRSWAGHAQKWDDLDTFIQEYSNTYLPRDLGMNLYQDQTDRFFNYDDHGTFEMFMELGINPLTLPHIGGSRTSQVPEFTQQQITLAMEHFHRDFTLYESL